MFTLLRESILGESNGQDLVDFTDLATKAKEKLGYYVLAYAQPLLVAMAELQIKPYTIASVKTYQRMMVFWTNLKHLVITLSLLFCRIVFVASIIGGVVSLATLGIWTIFAPIPAWCLWWFGASFLCFIGAGLVELYREGEDLSWDQAEWR